MFRLKANEFVQVFILNVLQVFRGFVDLLGKKKLYIYI
jgi:hypothetical protein